MSVPASSEKLKLAVADLRKKKYLISITVFSFLFKLCDQSWGYALFLKFYHLLFVVFVCDGWR